GVLQPVAEAAALVRAAGGVTVCDAAQAAGRVPLSMAALGVDALLVSAHKFGGPKGIGAVLYASERAKPVRARSRGGGQERGMRAGTQNVAGAAGFAAAAREALRDLASETARLAALRDRAQAAVFAAAPDATIFSAGAPRLPGTLAFAAPGLAAETLLIALDLAGIAVSSGAACSSGKVAPSEILAAMGVPTPLARCALRVSLGHASTAADVARFATAFADAAARMRRAPAA
ncbi:MAG: aminotransferase class V-fold PLP-dependent enzyme, partial [Hyphomicrobiales bacterium]|nr:aminotransferase class V-fold PLP-dependent enzyme [Hyphomicrobiales bacterium]